MDDLEALSPIMNTLGGFNEVCDQHNPRSAYSRLSDRDPEVRKVAVAESDRFAATPGKFQKNFFGLRGGGVPINAAIRQRGSRGGDLVSRVDRKVGRSDRGIKKYGYFREL